MNTYTHDFTTEVASGVTDLKAIAMAVLYGRNTIFEGGGANGLKISYEIPYSLSNISTNRLVQGVYNTSSQGIQELNDKPYAIKGHLVVCMKDAANNAIDIEKDLDGFIKFTGSGALGKNDTIYVGFVNSSKTEYYEPLSDAGITKVYYEVPRNWNNDWNVPVTNRPSVGGGARMAGGAGGRTKNSFTK